MVPLQRLIKISHLFSQDNTLVLLHFSAMNLFPAIHPSFLSRILFTFLHSILLHLFHYFFALVPSFTGIKFLFSLTSFFALSLVLSCFHSCRSDSLSFQLYYLCRIVLFLCLYLPYFFSSIRFYSINALLSREHLFSTLFFLFLSCSSAVCLPPFFSLEFALS